MSFSGYYYKLKSVENDLKIIIVTGYHKKKKKSKIGFIQINCFSNDGNSLFNELFYYNDFKIKKKVFELGSNSFSPNKITIKEKEIDLSINIQTTIHYPSRRIGKNVMGIYGFIPFVECKHFVHAIDAKAQGLLRVKKEYIYIDSAQAYIEGTYGKKFPESFFWTHFNQFKNNENTHFLFSIANPKWIFIKKKVHIGYLIHENQFYSLGSNQEFKLIDKKSNEQSIQFTFRNKQLKIKTIFNLGDKSMKLVGPSKTGLNRDVTEYTDASVIISISEENKEKVKLVGYNGTLENENPMPLLR
jgi:hypothetical protein